MFVTLSSRLKWNRVFSFSRNLKILNLKNRSININNRENKKKKNVYFFSISDTDFINAKIHREIHSMDNTIYLWNHKFSTVILKSPNFAHSYEISPPLHPPPPSILMWWRPVPIQSGSQDPISLFPGSQIKKMRRRRRQLPPRNNRKKERGIKDTQK